MQEWQNILKEAALRVKAAPPAQGRGPGRGVRRPAPRAPMKPTRPINTTTTTKLVTPKAPTAVKGGAQQTTSPTSPSSATPPPIPPDAGASTDPKKPWSTTSKVVTGAGASIAGLTGLASLANILSPGDISPGSIPEPGPDLPPEIGEIGVSAAGGAALGGLGSLLYGKLKDKPDLQRDTIVALVGAAAGSAYPFMKNGSLEKEGFLGLSAATIATIIAILGATGAGMGQSYLQHKDYMKSSADQQRALDSIERAKLQEAAMGRKAITHGTVGALGGGAIGGTLSNIYGKKTGKESLRRDVMSALAGAGIGGAAGLYSATKA